MFYAVLLAFLSSNKILIKLAKLKNILNYETNNIILQLKGAFIKISHVNRHFHSLIKKYLQFNGSYLVYGKEHIPL